MAKLPYVTSSGNIDKVLKAIKAAAVPERVSQDFVKTILKIPGGSGDQMTTYLKKINFASSDGKPTELYTKFRNQSSSGQAVAKAIKHAYAPLYVRSEFMHELSDEDLIGLIVEETGEPADSNPVKMTFNCIKALKENADFTAPSKQEPKQAVKPDDHLEPIHAIPKYEHPSTTMQGKSIGLNLGYTINLNLPATSDQAVFNAIFKSLKENLLRDDDV